MYVLVYYVPEEALEKTKNALFDAGAGSIGNYSKCSWQVKGEGQFLPHVLSSPYSGSRGELSMVSEYRVEMSLSDELKDKVIDVLKEVHPYETAAYHLVKVNI